MTLDERIEQYLKEQRKEKKISGLPERESPGFFGSVARGIDQLQASLYGTAGIAGSLAEKTVGIGEDLQEWGMEGYRRNIAEAEEHAATVTFKEAREDLSKLPTWVVEQLGGVLPSMGEAALGAVIGTLAAGPGAGTGIGAFAGKTVLRKTIKKQVEAQLKKKLKGKVVSKAVKNEMKDELEKQVAKAAFIRFGAKAGVGAAVFPMEAGGNYAELLEEHGVDAPVSAIVTGLAATSLEFAFGGGNLRLIDKFMPTGSISAYKRALKEGNTGFIKRFAKEVIKQAPAEFAQEAGQEVLSALNVVAHTDEKFFTAETGERVLESGAVGALAGGAGAIVGSIKSGPNVSKEDIQIAKQVEGTPDLTEEGKEVLFEDLIAEQLEGAKPVFGEPTETEINIADAETVSAGMTEKQTTRQDKAADQAIEKKQAIDEAKQQQADTLKAGQEEAAEQDAETKEVNQGAEALAEVENQRTHLAAISTPEGLMGTTERIIQTWEKEGDNRNITKAVRNTYKSLRGAEDNLKKLNNELTELEIDKVHVKDFYEASVVEGLEDVMGKRIEALEAKKASEEAAKEKEKPAVQAKIKEARPVVAKAHIEAKKKAVEPAKVVKKPAKVAVKAPKVVKTSAQITAANLEKNRRAAAERRIEATKTKAAKAKERTAEKAKKITAAPAKEIVVPMPVEVKPTPKEIEAAKTEASIKANKKKIALRKIEADKAARKGPFKYSEEAPVDVKGRTASTAEREIHRTNIDSDLKDFTKHFENVTKINVVKSVDDAPEYIRDKAKTDKVTPFAMYDENSKEIYVFSDKVKDSNRAKYEAWHELGHYSFDQLFGKEKANSILSGIKAKFPNEVAKHTVHGSEEVLIRKYLANDKDTLVTQLKHHFQKLAEKLGMEKQITDKEINAVVKQMRENLVKGRKVAEKAVAKDAVKYSEMKPTAKFLGWQEVPGKESLALYNVVGGKRHGSTVSAPTLKEEGIEIPETPAQVKPVQVKRIKAAMKKPVFYSQEYVVKETGQKITLKIPAEEALAKIDEDIFSLKVLRDCL